MIKYSWNVSNNENISTQVPASTRRISCRYNDTHSIVLEFHENITLLLFCFFVVLHHLIYLPSNPNTARVVFNYLLTTINNNVARQVEIVSPKFWRHQVTQPKFNVSGMQNQRQENLNDKIRCKLDKYRLKLRKHRTMKLMKHFLCIFYVMKFLIGRFFRVWLTIWYGTHLRKSGDFSAIFRDRLWLHGIVYLYTQYKRTVLCNKARTLASIALQHTLSQKSIY